MRRRWQLVHIIREPAILNPPDHPVAVKQYRENRQLVKRYYTRRGAEADRRRFAAIGSYSGEYLEYTYEVERL